MLTLEQDLMVIDLIVQHITPKMVENKYKIEFQRLHSRSELPLKCFLALLISQLRRSKVSISVDTSSGSQHHCFLYA